MMMSVKCVGTFCKDCPELEVENDTRPHYVDGELRPYENYLYCKHYKKCEKITDFVEKHITKEMEKKEEEDNG